MMRRDFCQRVPHATGEHFLKCTVFYENGIVGKFTVWWKAGERFGERMTPK